MTTAPAVLADRTVIGTYRSAAGSATASATATPTARCLRFSVTAFTEPHHGTTGGHRDDLRNTRYPGLRPITCGGPFDTATRQYLDNNVVYSHLVG